MGVIINRVNLANYFLFLRESHWGNFTIEKLRRRVKGALGWELLLASGSGLLGGRGLLGLDTGTSGNPTDEDEGDGQRDGDHDHHSGEGVDEVGDVEEELRHDSCLSARCM